tara:strand:- start:6 stop:242 length:237 start_codon:yes stop_codon:yes gene_type:complete
MSNLKLAEIYQKLKDFGITLEVLSKLTNQEAIHLFNYENAQMMDSINSDDLSTYYDITVWDWDEKFETNVVNKKTEHD